MKVTPPIRCEVFPNSLHGIESSGSLLASTLASLPRVPYCPQSSARVNPRTSAVRLRVTRSARALAPTSALLKQRMSSLPWARPPLLP